MSQVALLLLGDLSDENTTKDEKFSSKFKPVQSLWRHFQDRLRKRAMGRNINTYIRNLKTRPAILCFSFGFPNFFAFILHHTQMNCLENFQAKRTETSRKDQGKELFVFTQYKANKFRPSFEITVISAIPTNCTCYQESYQ